MKKPTCEFVFLHGFLGFPSDWDSVRSYIDAPTKAYSLSDHLFINKPTILIGYSMGGRAAMHLAHAYPEHVKHVILISSNIGTTDKKNRDLLEQSWLKKWEEVGTKSFLNWWYSKPLFATLNKEQIVEKRLLNTLEKAKQETALWGLSQTPNYWKKKPPCEVSMYYGSKDQKYKRLLKNVGEELPDVGHAAHIEKPKLIAELSLLSKYSKNL